MVRSELAKKRDCTKRVGFVLMWRRLFNFLSRNDRGSCSYKKTKVEKTQLQSIFRLQISSERAFFVTKLLFCHSKLFYNLDRVLFEILHFPIQACIPDGLNFSPPKS